MWLLGRSGGVDRGLDSGVEYNYLRGFHFANVVKASMASAIADSSAHEASARVLLRL